MPAKPVTVFVASDTKEAAARALRLRSEILGTISQWNFSEHDGETADIDEILGDILTPPFMEGSKVITIKRIDSFSAASLDKLADALAEIPEGVYITATAARIDKRGRFYREVRKRGNVVELDGAEDAELLQWVKTAAAELGLLEIPTDVARLLVERSGGSYSWLQGELAKLAAFQLSSSEPIGLDEVERLVSQGVAGPGGTAPFKLLDFISEGKISSAIGLLHKLLESGQPALAIFGTIAWQYRMVVAAASLQRAGIPAARVPQRLAESMNVKLFPAKKANQLALRLGYEKACEAFELIFTAGYETRLGVHSPEQALELLVIQLSRLV